MQQVQCWQATADYHSSTVSKNLALLLASTSEFMRRHNCLYNRRKPKKRCAPILRSGGLISCAEHALHQVVVGAGTGR